MITHKGKIVYKHGRGFPIRPLKSISHERTESGAWRAWALIQPPRTPPEVGSGTSFQIRQWLINTFGPYISTGPNKRWWTGSVQWCVSTVPEYESTTSGKIVSSYWPADDNLQYRSYFFRDEADWMFFILKWNPS